MGIVESSVACGYDSGAVGVAIWFKGIITIGIFSVISFIFFSLSYSGPTKCPSKVGANFSLISKRQG
jgi:hypothetical protein